MAAAAYEAQLRIRREGEEISCAQNDLNSWLSDLKKNNSRTKAPAKSKTTEPKLSVPTNPSAHNIEEERLRGNDFFSQGKYHDAIQCYTRCLSENEAVSTPVIYSNRAMAHLKLKTWSNAESDASHALAIDNGHSKSYQRRCVARQSLGKLRAAMIDAYTAEDCLGDIDTKAVNELQQKVYRALVNAVKRAPRRKITVEVNECTE